MQLLATPLPDLWLLSPQKHADERGFFARTYCEETLSAAGIAFRTIQCNVSFNTQAGTLRGMHFQVAPAGEPKIVRCTAGSIYDVAVDLRPESSTYCQWYGKVLSAEEHNAFLIPEGFAHGFITLEDNSEVFYHMGAPFSAPHARGVRWNDPAFDIIWPGEPRVISEKDTHWPDFTP